MLNRLATFMALPAVLLPALACAHLCDNVYRQADKVIIKPEFTNLIMKDQCTFKVFIQNNMDRGVEQAGLVAESDAFEIKVTPYQMPIQKARNEKDRVSFDVALSVKEGLESGAYRIKFRLVGRGSEGGGREIASYAVDTGTPAAFYASSRAVTVRTGKGGAPEIDGRLTDRCWRGAATFTNFLLDSGKPARDQSVMLLASDGRNLYLGAVLAGGDMKAVAGAGGRTGERLSVALGPAGAMPCKIDFDARGESRVRSAPLAADRSATVKSAVRLDAGKDTWTLEAAIPLRELTGTDGRAQDDWKLNVVRFRRSGAGGEEKSCWAGSPSSAERLESFGTLKLASAGPDR